MKQNILIVSLVLIFILFSDCKKAFGPSLPSEIIGTWKDDRGYYYLEYEFTKDHVYYHDFASNTGGSASWDCEVDETIDDHSFIACSDYYYFHVSGNTLYLIRKGSPQDLENDWWTDENLSKHVLTKQ